MRSLKEPAGVLIVAMAMMLSASAQDKPQTPPVEKPPAAASKADDAPVVTHHEVRVNGRALKYTATTGYLPIKSASGDVEARLFFMAYTLDDTGDVRSGR